MTSILGWSFVQRGVLAALLVAGMCSFLSPFVVMRKMAFMGAGIAHAAFAGVAIALLMGADYTGTALAFALVVALAADRLSGRGRGSVDVAVGVLFAASMALAVVLLSRTPGYYADVMSYLFGNVLAVTRRDLVGLGLTAAAVVTVLVAFLKEMLALCLDEEQALASGLPVRWLRPALVSAVAAAVVMSVKVVGIVLASALLVIPGAAAERLARDFRSFLSYSLLHGLAASLAGMAVSLRWDLPPGPGIVLVATGLFAVSLAAGRLRSDRPEGGAGHKGGLCPSGGPGAAAPSAPADSRAPAAGQTAAGARAGPRGGGPRPCARREHQVQQIGGEPGDHLPDGPAEDGPQGRDDPSGG